MVTQAIKFEVTKNKEFRFKKLQDNVKAKQIGEVIKVYYQFQRVK